MYTCKTYLSSKMKQKKKYRQPFSWGKIIKKEITSNVGDKDAFILKGYLENPEDTYGKKGKRTLQNFHTISLLLNYEISVKSRGIKATYA